MNGIYEMADLAIDIEYRAESTRAFLSDYIAKNKDLTADFSVRVTESDRIGERAVAGNVSFGQIERACILRKIAANLCSSYEGFLLHASCVGYRGGAYAFAAKSGTGKSTHARLLKELLGDELVYVNDDKPFVRLRRPEDLFYVYGSPWKGKSGLGENVSMPLRAVCFLRRGKENRIVKIADPSEAIPLLAENVPAPENSVQTENLFLLFDLLRKKTSFYLLECNANVSAAETSFGGMIKNGS